MKQYEIWLAKLPSIPGSSVQQGVRPVIIVSNDAANEHSPVITVVPLTSQLGKNALPTHVFLNNYMLNRPSLALCEQILSVDKARLIRRIGWINKAFDRIAIQHALLVQLNMAA